MPISRRSWLGYEIRRFPQRERDKLNLGQGVTKDNPEKGDIWKIELDESNGITPKDGFDTREKFFVVLGVLPDGTLFGGVVFNSKVNANLPQNIQDCLFLPGYNTNTWEY